MTHNNIDLSLRVFNSNLKFIVSDDEIKLVLDKDLKLRLNFDTNSNTIVLNSPSKDVNEVEEDVVEVVEDNTYIEEEKKEPDDTYWENGILKHREVEDVSVEDTESSNLEDPNTENRFN
jgi:hypothetical protein